MFYHREMAGILEHYTKFPVVAILGPRQSGKTTLAQHFFKKHIFLNLEDLELRTIANQDPKSFLRRYENEHGLILDEFQNCPELLSYIQVESDAKKRPGYFVLTGSQNFLVNEAITQSLAGRVGILTLLPLSIQELGASSLLHQNHPEETIFKGGYPNLYSSKFEPSQIYPSYIHTYLERDVRQLININSLYSFQKFLKLCAARVGQLINFSDLAINCGISVPTVHQWLSLLEASYIIFLLRPHWVNFNKRVTKTPKLYFYDTGLACSLLEIDSSKSLLLSPFYGPLFECFIIADLIKQYYNRGLPAPLYFWRDRNGVIEVDCLIEQNAQLIPVEIKSGETYSTHYFDSLDKWAALSQQKQTGSYVVYGGQQSFSGEAGNLVPWHDAGNLIAMIKAR